MRLFEFDKPTDNKSDQLFSFWGLAELLKIDHITSSLHDSVLPWINNNRRPCINSAIKKASWRELSKLQLYIAIYHNRVNRSEPVATMAEYNAFKASSITLWRGGAGVYNPEHDDQPWYSYTYNKDRVNTFFEYNGTNASKAYRLDKRDGAAWVVELTIPVNEILLYLQASSDSEVIISATSALHSTVITQI